MDTIFFILTLLCFLLLILGLIKPSALAKKEEVPTRKKILKILMPLILVFFILFGLTTDNSSQKTIDFKVIEVTKINTLKYSTDILVEKKDGKFPSELALQKIAQQILENNKGYKNYFVSFSLPNMKGVTGAYATAHNQNGNNPSMKAEILTYMLESTEYKKDIKIVDGNYVLDKYDQ